MRTFAAAYLLIAALVAAIVGFLLCHDRTDAALSYAPILFAYLALWRFSLWMDRQFY